MTSAIVAGCWDSVCSTPQYMVRHGIVFLRGQVTRNGGGSFQWNDRFFDLPASIQPEHFLTRDIPSNGNLAAARIHIDGRHSASYAGYFTFQAWNEQWGTGGAPDRLWLDGIMWAL